jgi:hypothetical protein
MNTHSVFVILHLSSNSFRQRRRILPVEQIVGAKNVKMFGILNALVAGEASVIHASIENCDTAAVPSRDLPALCETET